MRKHVFFLSFLAALLMLPLGTRAQDTVTVCNGTETNSNVPFYGLWVDDYTRMQMIYPEETLSDLVGSNISKMTFYLSQTASSNWGVSFTVKMWTVNATTLSTYLDDPSATIVYNGPLSATSSPLEIEFDEEFNYTGGNLLVEIYNNATGTFSSAYFYGITSTGSSISGYSSSSTSSASVNQRNFLPKTTFEYTPTGGAVCFKPNMLAVSGINENGATVNWHTRNGETQWNVYLNGQFEATVYDSTYTFASLNPNTLYTAGIQAVCTDTVSGLSSISFRTNCASVAELPFYDNFESYETGSGNFPPCWFKLRGTATYPYVSTSSAIEGTKNLFWSMSNTTDTVLVCTGALPISADAMHIAYWLGGSLTTEVGIITDTSDLTTFIPLNAINTESYWRQIDVYTDTVESLISTSETFLAFRTIGSGFIYIDGVLVDEISDCRRPIDGDISEVSHESITITWIPDPASTGTNYEVLMSTVNVADENDTNATLFSGITDTFYTAIELNAYTTYYFWVRSNCGATTTDWYRIGGATTYRTCYPLANVTVDNAGFTSAHISWDYASNGRGLAETGVHMILRDANDSILREWDAPYTDGSDAFITGLEGGTTYSIVMLTLCDPDTASAVTITFSTATCGEVAPGGTTTSYFPFYGTYDYGFFEALYPATAVATMDTITGLSWEITSAASSYPQRLIEVWIGATNMTSFTTSSYVDTSMMTKVFDGSINVNATGWTSVNFDQPWPVSHDGANIVVAVHNKTGQWSGITWRGHTGGVGVYGYQDPVPSAPYTISSYSSTSTTTTVADIKFLGGCAVDCIAPNLAITNVDVNSVDLHWARGQEETSWILQYNGDSVWVEAEAPSDTAVTIENLTGKTFYSFRVGVVCDNGDTLWSNIASTWTLCEPLTELPYAETFENMPAGVGNDPLCWQFTNLSTNTSSNHYVSTTTPHAGTQCMYFYPYGTQYLISPAMPLGTNPADLEITFWGKINSSGSSRIEVGFMTDPTDVNTFRSHGTILSNASTWTEYTLYTDTTTLTENDQYYVVFRVYSSGAYANYIDDISIGSASCRRPRSLHTSNLTAESVTVSWLGMEGATYEYYYSTADSIPEDATLLTSESASVSLDSLNPSTAYYFWARTICDEESTTWSATLSFRTACGTVSAPWYEDFNSWNGTIDECWARYSGLFDTTPALTTTTSGWYTSTYSMGGSPNVKVNVYSTSCKYWLVTPYISVDDGNILTFDATVTDYGSSAAPDPVGPDDRFVIAATTDSGTTWTPLYQFGGDPNRDDEEYTSLNEVPRNIVVPLGDFAGQIVRIAFYGESTVSGGDNDLHIDNIALVSADCLRPSHVRINRQAESATFTWVDYSTENDAGFELIVSPTNSMTDSNAMTFTLAATDTSAVVTGLTAQTRYYYFIRSLCDEEPTADSWTTGQFTTTCLPAELPYSEDFETYNTGSGNIPSCWEITVPHPNTSTIYPYITTNNGSKCLYFYGYYSGGSGQFCIASPRFSEPLSNLMVSFDYKPYSSTYAPMTVYLATDPTDPTTYHRLGATTTGSSTMASYEFYADTVSDLTLEDTGYVVFSGVVAGSNYTYGYLDNVYISVADPCRRPSSITVDEVTYYTATISWATVNGNNGYRVKWSTSDDIETADSLDVLNEEATLTELHNGTTYYVWVQTICDEGISTDARGTHFTTEISCYPITNVQLVSRSATGAAFEWGFTGQGNDVVEVLCEVFDLTDSTSTIAPTMGSTYHLVGGLNPNHTYVMKFYTVCDPDTSAAYLLSLATDGDACKTIRGTTTVSYAPFYGLYNYGYSQMLYTGSDVAGLDTLTGIAFRTTSVPSSYPQRPVNVWMGNTSMTSVSSSSLMNESQMTQVASNYQLDVSDTGWTTITFSQPFVHTAGSNIMIAVQNLTGHYSSFSWGAHDVTSGGYTMWYTDSGVQSYASHSGTNNSSTTKMPDIKFLGNCGNHGGDSNLCAAPVVLIDSIDSTSAHIIWLPGTDETSWIAEYMAIADTEWTSAGTISGSDYTFAGLAPATQYIFRLGTVCDEDTVYSTALLATTECVYEHLPFDVNQADIVAIQTDGFTTCWDYTSFYRGNNSTYGVSYVYTYSAAGRLVLPAIAEPLNTAQLRTTVAATSSSATRMRVGVMENNGSVTWVDTINLPHAANVGEATEQVVYLDSYTGTGNRVVIGSMSSNYMYFLDLHLEALDACRRVDNLVASDITDDSATISWTPDEGQTQWLVYLNGEEVATVSAPTYTFAALDPTTSYTIGVRTLCGAGDTSRMVIANFTTTAHAYTLPFATGFEANDDNVFEFANSTNGWYIDTAVHNTGSRALYISKDNGATNTYNTSSTSASYAYRLFIVDTGEYAISYDWRAEAEEDYDYLRVFLAPSTATFTAGSTHSISEDGTPAGWIALDGGSQLNSSSSWQTVTETIEITTAGSYYLVFYWYNDGSVGTQPPAAIDNISFASTAPVECDEPVITNTTASGTSIRCEWTGDAQSYEVAIAEGSWVEPTNPIATSNTTYTFSGLHENTTYVVGVRAVCGPGNYSDWVYRTVQVNGIDDVAAALFTLFPNPASQMVTLDLGSMSGATVELLDQSGRSVYRVVAEGNSLRIDVSNLAKGAYYVRVTDSQSTAVSKLIVE